MKIGPYSSASGVGRIAARMRPGAAGAAVAEAPRPAGDVATFMGIPAAELTPKVQAALSALIEEVERLRIEVEQHKERADYLERLADEDALLPIINRRAFVRELSRIMAFSQRYGTPSSIVYFDVNGMKHVNDNLGHAAGDAVLLHVAHTLVLNTRQSDIVGRLGGDEFGIILAQADDTIARMKAERLAHEIETRAVPFDEHELRVSLAFGHYTFHGEEDIAAALEAADRAMYAHKKGDGAA